ncbi:MAG: SpoIIE family protein phosphatase [Planctomycetota bacterium]
MTLRRRFLVLLLAASLAPLVVLRAVELFAFNRLSGDVVDNARQALVERTRRELTLSLEGFRSELERESQVAELLVQLQRNAIETRLAQIADRQGITPTDEDAAPEPIVNNVPVYQAQDFAGPSPRAPGVVLSAQHGRLEPTSANRLADPGAAVPTPTRVSFLAQLTAFYREPGPDALRVAEAMADLVHELAPLREQLSDYILWQYAAFTDGVMVSYPGAGFGNAASEGFDPTLRPWYRIISSPGALAWSTPTVDVPTGRVVFTVSAGLAWPDGSLAGVTAIDIPAALALDKRRISASWGAEARLLLIDLQPLSAWQNAADARQGDALLPIVVMDADRERIRPGPLQVRDPLAVARRIRGQSDGVFEAMFGQTRAVVGFARLSDDPGRNNGNTYLLVAAPTDFIAAPIDSFAESVEQTSWGLAAGTGVVMLLIALLSVFAALRTSRTVARPIQDVAGAARALADGDFDARATVRSRSREVRELQNAFHDLGPKLEDRLRVRQALNVAMEVQRSLLPSETPDWPDIDVAGESAYCDETGGDYYDFLEMSELDHRRTAVVIGDVTGHGVAAALLMATARGILRSRAGHPGSLADLFDDMNQHLCGPDTGGRFMTLFFLMIEHAPLRLRFLSAGHDPALLYWPDEDRFETLEGRDIPLGIEPGWNFRELAYPGDPTGAVALLATDGVWEAFNPRGEMYGKDRMMGVVRKHGREPARQILKAIREDVQAFADGLPSRDDITLVVLRFGEPER